MTRNGGTAKSTLSAPADGIQKWSGNIYGHTGCDAHGENCQTGLCPGNGCNAYTGAQGPLTLAEFTLQTTASDFYDITTINGVNVSMEMAPAAGQTFAPAPGGNAGFYWCGNPGGVSADNPHLTGCTWAFNPTIHGTDYSAYLHMVVPGGAPCTSNSQCTTSGEECGLAAVVGTTQVTQSCGKRIGWWSADEVCVYTNNSFGAPFHCSRNSYLYGCTGTAAASCYNVNTSTCCGCPNWPYPSTSACVGNNSTWQAESFPWLKYLKDACPTSYTFPYDDKTSTFQCQTTGTTNATNYDITFCPK